MNRGDTMYLGTCAGWFHAGVDFIWEGILYDYPHHLGIFPRSEGAISDIAPWESYAITPMNGLNVVYFGGPTWGWKDTDRSTVPSGVEILANFDALDCDCPAAVYWKGYLLFSPHLEAHEDIFVRGLTRADRLRNYAYRAE